MKMTVLEQQKREEEENQKLIYRVVEYVEPIRGQELLSKFPDNSVYYFDYAQSSIWSPLLPHPKNTKNFPKPISLIMDMEVATPPSKRKHTCGFWLINKSNLKRVTTKIKKNITNTAFNINHNVAEKMKKKKKEEKKEDLDFCPSIKPKLCRPISTKGWSMVLKAASKQFKKKKKDCIAHVRLFPNA